MVKVGGKRNAQKVCKKQVNFSKTGGKFEICGRRLNKKSSEILADENQEIFREKVKLRNCCTESEIFSKFGGNLKQGECIMVSEGNGRPWSREPAYSQALIQSKIHRQRSDPESQAGRQAGRQSDGYGGWCLELRQRGR